MEISKHAMAVILRINTMSLSPEDAESLLGFKPGNGSNVYTYSDTPNKQIFRNVELAFGTLIVNMLAGAINDEDNFEMARPDLTQIESSGNSQTGFDVDLEFFVRIDGVKSDNDVRWVAGKLIAALPHGWQIIAYS